MFEIRDEFNIPFTDVELNMFIRDIESTEDGKNKAMFLRFLAGRNLTTLDDIIAYSGLSEATTRSCLSFFIGKHIVIYFEEKDSKKTYYCLFAQNITAQYFAPLLLAAINRNYGEVAAKIVSIFLNETARSHAAIISHPQLISYPNVEAVFAKLVADKILVSEANFFAASRVAIANLVSDGTDAFAESSKKIGGVRGPSQKLSTKKKVTAEEASILEKIVESTEFLEESSSLAARGAFCLNFNWLKIHVFTNKIEELFATVFRAECGKIARVMLDKGFDHSLSNGIAGSTNAIPLKMICETIFKSTFKKQKASKVIEYNEILDETFENVIDDDEDDEEMNPQFVENIHELLLAMSRDSNSLVSRAGGSGEGSSFTLNIDAALSLLAKKIIDGVLLQSYSEKARRIYRILEDVGFLTEKELPQVSMMTPVDAREAIYALMRDDLITNNEVSKTNDFLAARTYQFFGINSNIKKILLERAWKAYDNTRIRLENIGSTYESDDESFITQIHALEIAIRRLTETIIILSGK